MTRAQLAVETCGGSGVDRGRKSRPAAGLVGRGSEPVAVRGGLVGRGSEPAAGGGLEGRMAE